MKEFQITIVVMMTMMTLALVMLLPKQVAKDPVANRSRWLMAIGLSLIGLQFLTQYIGDFRSTDINMAVIINIAFFIPCSAFMCLSILNLQQQGKLKKIEKWIWVPTWILAMALLATASIEDKPLLEKSSHLIWHEIGASVIYGFMQFYYSYLQIKELKRMEQVLDNYYDNTRDGLLTWMKINVILLASMAFFVPIVIYSSHWVLRCFGALLFTGLFFQWFCFSRYVISGEAKYMSEAEEDAVEEMKESQELSSNKGVLAEDTKQRIEKAVTIWINHKNYLRKGITSPDAAREMKLPRYQLSSWIKESGYTSFSNWITTLRVEHAKQVLAAHRDWSNETIADQCGISLSHFQKVFHEKTGMTPAQYLQTLQ